MNAPASDRIPELDGVRGIAVMSVILYHAFFWSMNDGGSLAAWSLPARIVAQLTHAGWLGVDLFFVLSGFLITGILLETRESPRYFRAFYGRRALRILPLYYLLLLAIALLYPHPLRYVALSAVFLANLTPLFGVPALYGALWSLAVEEHFYLVWPWIVRAAPPRALWALGLLLVIGEPLLRVFGYQIGTDTYSYTWYRLDGLAYGALLALFLRSPACSRRRLGQIGMVAALAGAAMLVAGAPFGILSRKQVLGATLQYSAAQLAFLGLLAGALASSGRRRAAPLRLRALRRCGDLSYCLYLIHILVFGLYDQALQGLALQPAARLGPFGAVLLRAAVVLLLCFALAELSFRYLETPILSLKRHLRYRD